MTGYDSYARPVLIAAPTVDHRLTFADVPEGFAAACERCGAAFTDAGMVALIPCVPEGR